MRKNHLRSFPKCNIAINRNCFLHVRELQTHLTDRETPNITSCPGNQTISTRPNSRYGYPTWPMPTAEDNSGSVVINCTHRSGDAFRIGDTTVECTASDPSDNSDMCSFIITVVGESSWLKHTPDVPTKPSITLVWKEFASYKYVFSKKHNSIGRQNPQATFCTR